MALRKLTLKKRFLPDPSPPNVAVAAETIGQRIRTLREAQSMTQENVAKAAKMHRSDLSDLERGEHDPTFEKLRHIARGLGISLAELVKGLDLNDG